MISAYANAPCKLCCCISRQSRGCLWRGDAALERYKTGRVDEALQKVAFKGFVWGNGSPFLLYMCVSRLPAAFHSLTDAMGRLYGSWAARGTGKRSTAPCILSKGGSIEKRGRNKRQINTDGAHYRNSWFTPLVPLR